MSSKAWRWSKRIVLGLIAFVILAVGVVLAVLHTDWGRETVRKQIEARLDQTFVGGASIGELDGSVLGTIVLRDVVLNGPDGKPAITIDKLSLGVPVMPLVSKQIRVTDLHAEGVDVDLRRDPDGQLQASRMIRPGPKSGFAVDIPELEISDAHVRVEGTRGSEDMNFDNIHIAGDLRMPTDEPLEANLLAMAHWRERNAPIWLDTNLRNDDETLTIGSLIASVGDVHVTGAGVRITKPQQASLARWRPTPASFSGVLAVDASKSAIAKLAPDVELPVDDIALSVIARPVPLQPWTHVTLAGTIDGQRVLADIDADLDARRARGLVTTGMLNLTKLTSGRLEGRGTTVIAFDGIANKEPGALPIGGAMIHASGDIAGMDNALATIAVTSTGEQAATAIAATARGSSAQIGAQIKKRGERLTLETSRVIARVRDPSKMTGGKAPVHGSLDINLRASGALSPQPDLAVTGRVVGSRLRMKDLSIRSLKLAIDARNLPAQPIGRAEMEARDIERGNIYLRELDMTAANREDGKIAVTMRSRPRTSPWLVEADALVTPGDTVTIDLERHHIRAGSGADWRGTTGQIVIGPERIDVRDLASASEVGKLEVAGHYHRLGRDAGDLKAHVELDSFDLANVSKYYRGNLEGRVDVARTNGKFAGVIEVDAEGVALDPRVIAFDANARIEARPDQLLVDAKAWSPRLGTVELDVDVDAPDDITNATHWKKLHREHIRHARLQLVGLDVGKLASLAKAKGEYGGRIDGDIRLSPTETGGLIQLKRLMGPPLKNLGPLSANMSLAQTGPDELRPTLVATIDDREAAGTPTPKPLARIEAQATLAMADHLFDPEAWQKLGRAAFKGGALRVDDVMIEPPLLDRMQVTTNMRGRASFLAEVAPAMKSLKTHLAVHQLRGNPIAVPTTLVVVAQIDETDTSATLALSTADRARTRLLDFEVSVPVSLAKLIENPQAFRTAPIEGKATVPNVPAKRMLETFGRTQVTGGRLSGTVDIAGTVAKPTVHARLAGTNIQVPPGAGGQPVQAIQRVALDARWDGTTGKVALDARQPRGTLELLAEGNPKQLDSATVSLTAKHFDLQPLLAFAPGPAGGAAGRLDANLQMTGLDLRRTKLAGELHVTGGRVPLAPQIGTLYRAKIDVVVAESARVSVDGRLGGGTVKANAQFGLEGAIPTNGEAKIALREVSPIGIVEPDIDADITAKLTRRSDAWVANVVVKNGVIKVPDGRGEALDPVGMPEDMVYVTGGKFDRKQQPRAVGDETRPVSPTLIANIEIQPTYIESNEVRGYVKGQLRVEREAGAVSVVGKIEAQRGNLDLFGRRYQLDRAVVRFDGSTDPLLDVVITHDFPEVTTRTQIRGRLSDPELIMTSDPGTYSQGQLLGFLLGGEPEGQPADGNPRDKAVGAGASFVANKIGGYVKDALPIDVDVLRYEAATASSGAAITVGTWLTRSLFIAYRRRIEARPDENAGEGEIEYWITRKVVIEGVVGDRGYNGVDLLWRKRY